MLASRVTPLLEVTQLVRAYAAPGLLRSGLGETVLHRVSFSIPNAGALGVVGESGSGKSTLARTVLALERPQSGSVRLEGVDLFAASPIELRRMRARMQAVFQDPNGSLDPRMTIGRIVGEPIAALERGVSRMQRLSRVCEVLDSVGLPASAVARHPHEFSGGQRQRIAIARALATRPGLVVADEPVSALDVSVQAQILELIARLRERGIGWLFISHDLAVVRAVCDEAIVLLRGHVVEQGPAEALLVSPLHPYTRTLVAAGTGAVADAAATAPPGGCPHVGACPLQMAACANMPELRVVGDRRVACHAVA